MTLYHKLVRILFYLLTSLTTSVVIAVDCDRLPDDPACLECPANQKCPADPETDVDPADIEDQRRPLDPRDPRNGPPPISPPGRF